MKKKLFSNFNGRHLFAALIILSTIILSISLVMIANVRREKRVAETTIRAQEAAASIELTLDSAMEASRTLMNFYTTYGDECMKDLGVIGSAIAENHPYIDSMYLAPKAVIAAAWPEEVAPSTVGFEMLKDPMQGPRAQLAIDTGRVTVAGPHNLVEGSSGFIIRNPLFEGDEFIGFTIIVLNWDSFTDEIRENLTDISKDYYIAVRKKEADATAITDDFGYIISNCDRQVDNTVEYEFEVPNDKWIISAEPVKGWRVFVEMIPHILLALLFDAIVITTIMLGYSVLDRSRKLRFETENNRIKTVYMSQLKEALDKAERAEKAKTEFLSRMSHDIRTPLNGIIGLLEISDKHPDDRALVDSNRKKIRLAANHLLDLISDVLTLSKMDADTVRLAHEPFNLKSIAEDVLTLSNMRAAEYGVTIKKAEGTAKLGDVYAYGSPLHLRQIFLNILSNAIKYNKPGGTVECKSELLERTEYKIVYRFTIRDTGIGMSPEFVEHLFEPFTQEHTDARSTYQGTGLGMAIVKKLVDRMGGTIEVQSTPDVGSTFMVTLPFDLASKEDMPEEKNEVYEDLRGLHLLVVEDNDLNLEIAEAILTDLGATITAARDGREAVDIFKTATPGTFDAILMDLMMPVLDGYGATREIRSLTHMEAATIPIIAMTANAFEEDARKCREAGMNDHVTKPIEVPKLLKALSIVHRRG
ncbi:MAG: ATP-binding protein [Eubacteriales bacterium]|nr:ATP-binding protein [Eubacteriales bacterium]